MISLLSQFPQQQLQALSDLYYTTNGDHWIYGICPEQFHWNFSQVDPNPCTQSWCGVSCDVGNITILGLYLSDYALTGELPSSIYLLEDLEVLNLEMNFINGTIPDSLGQLLKLQELYLGYNSLVSSIPPIFTRLQNLSTIELIQNFLTGQVPVNFLQAKAIRNINFAYNSLSGNISTWLSVDQWTTLVVLDLRNNHFSGRLPVDVSPSGLEALYLKQNSFTGPIPDIFSGCSELSYLFLSYNHFTGTFPPSLNVLSKMTTLIIDENSLTGSLDSGGVIDWRNLMALSTLSMISNYFTGEFVASLCSLTPQIFNLGYNSLHGLLPPPSASPPDNPEVNECQSTLFPSVSIFTLQGNYFSGPLHKIFNTSLHHETNSLALSNNRFTGSLSGEYFLQSPNLQIYGVGGNCLSGTLPPELCRLPVIQAFLVDGASTAENCKLPIVNLPFLGMDAFMSKNEMTGTIPSCYFDFVFLTQLHLSGNGFTGSISLQRSFSTFFTDLSLSHNRLTGSIPDLLYHHSYYKSLDLSYNKLSGYLENVSQVAFDPVYTQVSLNDNRLSGKIPAVFKDIQSISLLQGNMFSCNNLVGGGKDGNLPPADPNYSEYMCGSNVINNSIYLWLYLLTAVSVVALSVSMMAGYRRRKRSAEAATSCRPLRDGYSRVIVPVLISNSATVQKQLYLGSNLSRYFSYSLNMRRFAVTVAAFIIVVLLPLYSALSVYYRTYKDSYAWFISAAYLSGTTTTVTLAVFFTILLAFLKYSVSYFFPREVKNYRERKWKSNQWIMWLIAWFINVSIMITADSLYVYLIVNRSTQYEYLIQMVLALFKLGWNDFGLFRMVFWLKVHLKVQLSDYDDEYQPESPLEEEREDNRTARVSGDEVSSPLSLSFEGVKTVPLLSRTTDQLDCEEQRDSESSRGVNHHVWFSKDHLLSSVDFRYLTYMSIVNKVAIPCLAIAFISSSCLYNALVSSDPETAFYEVCYGVGPIGDSQCVNILGSSGGDDTAFTPSFSYSFQCSSAFLTDYLPVFVFMFIWSSLLLPGLLLVMIKVSERLRQRKKEQRGREGKREKWLLQSVSEEVSEDGEETNEEPDDSPFQSEKESRDTVFSEETLLQLVTAALPIGWKEWPEQIFQQHTRQLIFHRKQLLTLRISYTLAVMIVFGSLFPPLAVIACLAVISLTLFEDYVTKHLLLSKFSPSRGYFEEECREIDRNVHSEMKLIFCLAASLQGFLLFDTCGDTNGWADGLIPMIVMIFVPLLLDLFRSF